MKFIIQLLKIGAFFSLLYCCLIGFITISPLLLTNEVLKVQNKHISENSYVIEGVDDNGGKTISHYSESFFNKAQIGDTIRYNATYQLLVKDGHIESIYVHKDIWLMLAFMAFSLFPVLIFFPNSRILRHRFSYWFIGVCELANIFFLITSLFPSC